MLDYIELAVIRWSYAYGWTPLYKYTIPRIFENIIFFHYTDYPN
jgi:hypothetical protein